MVDDYSKLLEWTIFFVKNKDIIKKEILDYKILKDFVEFQFKDKIHTYFIYPNLNNEILNSTKKGYISVVCNNNKNNLNFLIKNWNHLINNPKLSLIFANPKYNQRWVIFPYIHNKIIEKNTLKLGLNSLFESVQES